MPESEQQSQPVFSEKQRLSLARAFLRQPNLLILDEASANLDEDTEDAIATVIKSLRGRCTILVVSHPPRMLKSADQIRDLSLGFEGEPAQ